MIDIKSTAKVEEDTFVFLEYPDLKNKKRKYYLAINLNEEKMFVDTRVFPNTCMLCAMCDGVSILQSKLKRTFITFFPLDWIINGWGGPKEFVDEAIKCKEKHIPIMKEIKEE